MEALAWRWVPENSSAKGAERDEQDAAMKPAQLAMTWTEHHRTSELHASRAEQCARLGKREDARALYAFSAVARTTSHEHSPVL